MAKAKRAEAAEGPAEARYILLPPSGIQAVGAAGGDVGTVLRAMSSSMSAGGSRAMAFSAAPRAKSRLKILDSVSENGAKLVEMSLEALHELRAAEPGLRIVPEVFYKSALYRPEVESRFRAKAGGVSVKITLTVKARGGGPIKGVNVVAFTDFAAREGAQGTTNASGKVSLSLGAASKKVERLYAFPSSPGLWGSMQKNITIKSGTTIELEPINFGFVDCVRNFYGGAALTVGKGVTVGVIDTGIDTAHPDLVVAGGQNTVTGESPGAFGDNGAHHGTHVGGIIAARGTAPTGMRGVAPGASLRSYRVFGQDAEGASNFAIIKAIDAAVADGCDLINMSLGGGTPDAATSSAIAHARASGALVIVAAGNDDRSPVSFPASDPRSIAVSAMGRKGAFPAHSEPEGDVAAPFGTDPKNFIAAFSNIGPEIDVTGPGVGVISTIPGGYGIMSGTSMACPAVTGAAARLLAANPAVLSMPRDQSRSDEIAKLLLKAAKSLGFGVTFEGSGLPS